MSDQNQGQDRQGAVPGITAYANGGFVVSGPDAMRYYRLCVLRGAVKLELLGMRHSSGRSVLAQVKRELGLKPRTPGPAVLAALDARIEMERAAQNLPRN